jgi:hypothetical protein
MVGRVSHTTANSGIIAHRHLLDEQAAFPWVRKSGKDGIGSGGGSGSVHAQPLNPSMTTAALSPTRKGRESSRSRDMQPPPRTQQIPSQ